LYPYTTRLLAAQVFTSIPSYHKFVKATIQAIPKTQAPLDSSVKDLEALFVAVLAAAPVEVTARERLVEVTLEDSATLLLADLSVAVDTPETIVFVLFSTADLQT
jgi:hypothetical protein